MKTLTTHLSDPCFSETSSVLDKPVLFLDIETTGLTPDLSTIFMIGCGQFLHNRLEVFQWMADSLLADGETEILNAFAGWLDAQFGSAPVRLITYNGQAFDLPFLRERWRQCGLPVPEIFSALSGNHLDLYRKLKPLKPLLPLPNLKLKTLAAWFDLPGTKSLEGRQLIKAYHNYLQNGNLQLLDQLFEHNLRDIEALGRTLPLCRYFSFFSGAFDIHSLTCHDDDQLKIQLTPNAALPKALSYEAFNFRLNIQRDLAELFVPVHQGRLRYYHRDIKNYVFLPEEDCAIPKSMAAYVDRSHWKKISRETCYTWFSLDSSFTNDFASVKKYVAMVFELFGFSG